MNDIEKSIAEKMLANIHIKIGRALNPCVEVEVYNNFLQSVAMRRDIWPESKTEVVRHVAPPPVREESSSDQTRERFKFWKNWRIFG